ncbi:hypothetical protein C8Q75DRAFT_760191 [Abortiporus biennis]|nr:hypothetical protein C8Q75DRAFT_760191 [Abortiporus biennis]
MSTTVLQSKPTTLHLRDETLQKRYEPDNLPSATEQLNTGELESKLPTSEEILLAQLGHLASLHHASEYSLMKYGPKGAPLTYIPMCIYMPDYVRELREHQARLASHRAWWQCQRRNESEVRISQQHIKGIPSLRRPYSSCDLEEELRHAISSPLEPRKAFSSPRDPNLKTSTTHPINMSTIIPPELLEFVSARLSRAERGSAVMFNVAPAAYLHDLVIYSKRNCQVQRPSSIIPSAASANTQALDFLSKGPPQPVVPSLVTFLLNQPLFRRSPTVMSSRGIINDLTPVNARSTTPHPRSAVEASAVRSRSKSPKPKRQYMMFTTQDTPNSLLSSSSVVDMALTLPKTHISMPLLKSPSPVKASFSGPAARSRLVSLGNLYLSSCPGKKVRLNGASNGRSAVCRDLAQDLRRVKESGIRCIVCCLDDGELKYLGAPWPEYSCIASEIGLDVLRLPIPEGLAPLDAAVLNDHLSRLIETYTLNGHHTLVHCRGGVGRAGLIACCWLLKLGLCGWIDIQPESNRGTAFTPPKELQHSSSSPTDTLLRETLVPKETLQLLERLLCVVRRQRSLKAVETFEQVIFLIHFIEYLRSKAETREGSVSATDNYLEDWDVDLDV